MSTNLSVPVWEILDQIDSALNADTPFDEQIQSVNHILIEALNVDAIWCKSYPPLPPAACGVVKTPLSMAPHAEICLSDQGCNGAATGSTLLDKAVAGQRPLFISAPEDGHFDADLGDTLFKTFGAMPTAIIPLVASQTTWGALVTGQTESGQLSAEQRSLLLLLSKHLATTLHQRHLLNVARRHTDTFATLTQIAQTITSSLDIDDVIQRTMAGINTVLDVEAGSLLLVDEHSGELYFKITLRGENKQITSFRLRPGEGIAGWVVTHNQPTIVNAPASDPRFSSKIDRAIGFTTRMLLCAPLIVQGKPIGALEVLNKRSGPFNQTDQNLLVSMAASLGIALKNAMLYDTAQARAHKNEVINQVTTAINAGHGLSDTARLIFNQLGRLLDFQHVSLSIIDSGKTISQWLFDETGAHAANDPASIELAGSKLARLIDAGGSYVETEAPATAIFADDEILRAHRVNSRLTILLDTGGQPFGALTLGHRRPNAFGPADVTLLEQFAPHLAIVIEKAMLLDNMAQHTGELHTLNRLSEMLVSSIDLPGIVETTVNMLPKILPSDVQGVAIAGEDGIHLGLALPHDFAQTEQVRQTILATLAEVSQDYNPASASAKIVAGNPPVSPDWTPGSALSLPILTHYGAEGVIYAAANRAESFDGNFLRVFSLLVSQISAAVENARLFQQVEQERARLASILASSTDAVLVVNRSGRIVLDNPAAWTIMGVSESQRGRRLTEVTRLERLINLFNIAIRDGETTGEIPLDDGRTFFANLSPVAAGAVGVIGWVATMQDVSHFKALEQLKDEFVSTVSHDLRSPLSGILIATRLIEQVGDVTAEQRELLDLVDRRVRNMGDLIDNLLDVGRIEAGMDMGLEPCDISEIATEVALTLAPQATDKGLALNTDFDHSLPAVMANPYRLQQVAHNLLGNAIKYTPSGGTITGRTFLHSNEVRFQVTDSGSGIPASDQPHIFEKFYRVKGEHVTGIKGTGLGLAIVKGIVEKLGGRIWVESVFGEGSTFTVAFPYQ